LTERLARHISEVESAPQLYQRLVEDLQTELTVRSALVFEKSGPGDRYNVIAAVGVPDAVTGVVALPMPSDSSRFVRSTDTDLLPQTRAALRVTGCDLLFPVLVDNSPVAWIGLGGKFSKLPFDADDEAVLRTVAELLALGLRTLQVRNEQAQWTLFRRQLGSGAMESGLLECPACGACYGSESICQQDGSVLAKTLPIDRTINDRYRLIRRIGAGGMSTVYEASDLQLHRTVAVKIMLGTLFGNRSALHRFHREAKAAAALRHPHIVELYDFGRIGEGGAYLVMPRLQGNSWRTELNTSGKLAVHTAANWIDQVLTGLEAAHTAGVVHCDLKPENLLVSHMAAGGWITILDFGLARIRQMELDGATVTLPGMIAGTPGYVSPEQLKGDPPDERSDIFAIGVLAVESLTGCRPFTGVAYHEQPRWHGLDKPAYAELRAVLGQCLALHPKHRWASASAVRSSLMDAMRSFERA
jgi:hypothetical protein